MLCLTVRLCSRLEKSSQNERTRGMATLKAISIRLKSVKNIQKITQSMKMVSAAKFSRAERDLKQIKPLGEGVKKFYVEMDSKKPEDQPPPEKPKKYLYIAVTSDRGLCGAVHTSVVKAIRNSIKEPNDNIKIICVGDKSRSQLQRLFRSNILFVCQEVGRTPPTFGDASKIINEVLRTEFEYDEAYIVFNRFRSVVSNVTEMLKFYNIELVRKNEKVESYEDVTDDILDSFIEFSLVTMMFYAMKEGACSEQASRMTAMDNASKNAGDMINSLTLTFNRTRQAVITRELIEIISGASAL